MLGASKYLRISLEKCRHIEPIRKVGSVNLDSKVSDIFNAEHGDFGSDFKAWSVYHKEEFELQKEDTIGDIADAIKLDNINFKCAEPVQEIVNVVVDEEIPATPLQRNAFDVLLHSQRERAAISRKRAYPAEKIGNDRKQELFNDLLQYYRSNKLDFPALTANVEGKHCLDIVTDALWCITNNHQTISDRCAKVKGLIPVPKSYDEFTGYNDIKRKKEKSDQLDQGKLFRNSEALHSLLMKPYMNSSPEWTEEARNIESLAKCLHNYAEYLKTQNTKMKEVQGAWSPARSLDVDISIQFRERNKFVDDKYALIDEAVAQAGLNVPVMFDEHIHLKNPFENNMQRHRFFEGLALSVPLDILRFSPGGSSVTLSCIVQDGMFLRY